MSAENAVQDPMPPSGPKHWRHLVGMLARHGVTQVLDVGANSGQYAGYLRTAGYQGTILSFEPLTEAHAALTANAADDPSWHIAPRMALGAAPGVAEIHISAERDMSSLLPFTAAAAQFTPSSAAVGTESVSVSTLDQVWTRVADPAAPSFLKIDTQGYEEAILDGGADCLAHVRGVQLELSMVPIYEGEANWRTLVDRMEQMGFVLSYMIAGYYSRHIGRMLQFDGIFFREDPAG